MQTMEEHNGFPTNLDPIGSETEADDTMFVVHPASEKDLILFSAYNAIKGTILREERRQRKKDYLTAAKQLTKTTKGAINEY